MWIISVLLLAVCSVNAKLATVTVEQGKLRGAVHYRTTDNGTYYSFKGIPYAAPPVGKLRFRDPEPPRSWRGVREALRHRSICPQAEINEDFFIFGNENCLYLNVYTPRLNPKTPLPVMFYIHGGYYYFGSGNSDQFGPDFLLDRDVVLVTINYRLGVLGFLTLGIEEASGNAGLKDQVAALKWVKKNIAKFGGDPDNVTIFGQSSGGSAVTLHLLSPLSKGLFKRAIALSGVFLREFGIPLEPKRHAFLLTQQLGLYTQDPKEAFQFLQRASVRSLLRAKPYVLYSEKPRNKVLEQLPFRPVVEKNFSGQHFLIEDPEKLLRENKTNAVELILGHTSEEGIYRADTQKRYLLRYYPIYRELLVPSKLTYVLNSTEVLKFGDRIKKHYFGNNQISERNYRGVIKFFTYFNYVYHIHRFLELWTKTGNKAYFYEFSCYSERNIYGRRGAKYGLRLSTHSDDLLYIFDGPKFDVQLRKKRPSYKMIVQTCTLYTNFARYGNPTPQPYRGIIWEDYSKNQTYLDIGYKLIPKTMELTEVNFWRNIYKSAGVEFS